MGGMSAQQSNTKPSTSQASAQSSYRDQVKRVGVTPDDWKAVVKKAVLKYARALGYIVSTQLPDGKVQERIAPEYRGDLKDMYNRLYTILKLNETQILNWQAKPNQSFIITESDLVYALYRVALFIKNFPEAKDAVDKIYIIPNASAGTLVVYPHYLLLADIFMRHANIKYYRFQIENENGNLKSATVKFYVDGVDGSLDFTVFVNDLALVGRLKDKQNINSYPNLTVMLCKQALRQGLALYFPSVAIKMAISVDNFVSEDEFFANNRGIFEMDRGNTFVVEKPKPITNPTKHESAETEDYPAKIRMLLTKIHAQYNNDNDFMKFLGNRIRDIFNISQTKLTDPTIPFEIQSAIVDYLNDQANIETLYKSYREIVNITQID
jgi:hypothetical protein